MPDPSPPPKTGQRNARWRNGDIAPVAVIGGVLGDLFFEGAHGSPGRLGFIATRAVVPITGRITMDRLRGFRQVRQRSNL